MAAGRQNPYLLGPAIGWLAGILWWAGLMVAFGPSVLVTQNGERKITVASGLVYAPVVAIPWAAVGLAVGVIIAAAPGPCVPTAATVGTLAGGAIA